jgi:hypothetical protein
MEVIAEIVQWNDVRMLRTHFNKKKRNKGIFEIPDDLFKRWNDSIDEFWKTQHEIMKYQSGEKCTLSTSKGEFEMVNGKFIRRNEKGLG